MRFSMMDILGFTTVLVVAMFWVSYFSSDVKPPCFLAWVFVFGFSVVATAGTFIVGFIGWIIFCELLQIWARGR